MQKKHNNNMIRRIVDISMTVCLLFLMAYQVTGEVLHEWIGIGMTALVIVHQILNRKWYSAVFKGKQEQLLLRSSAVLQPPDYSSFCEMDGLTTCSSARHSPFWIMKRQACSYSSRTC